MGAMGLMWVFHEEQRATTYLLLVKFSEVWRILKFIQNFWHRLAVLSEELLCKLQSSFKELPLDGKKIQVSMLINMMTSTVMQF